MSKLVANAKLIKGMWIAVDDGRSHSLNVDLPRDDGTDLGPTALELCAMSHVGCYATIFVMTAKKSRIPIKDLGVKTESTKSEQEGTITEAKFEIIVKTDAPKDRIQRLHELTLRSCPVGKLFEKAKVKISYNLVVEK